MRLLLVISILSSMLPACGPDVGSGDAERSETSSVSPTSVGSEVSEALSGSGASEEVLSTGFISPSTML